MIEVSEHRFRVLQGLVKAGWCAAVVDDGVVVFFNSKVWQVVGGDAQSPSMRLRPDLDKQKLKWIGGSGERSQ